MSSTRCLSSTIRYLSCFWIKLSHDAHESSHLLFHILGSDLVGGHTGNAYGGLVGCFSQLISHGARRCLTGFLCGISGQGHQAILQEHDERKRNGTHVLTEPATACRPTAFDRFPDCPLNAPENSQPWDQPTDDDANNDFHAIASCVRCPRLLDQ